MEEAGMGAGGSNAAVAHGRALELGSVFFYRSGPPLFFETVVARWRSLLRHVVHEIYIAASVVRH